MIIFVIGASLSAAAFVLAFGLMPQVGLKRDDDEKLKEEGKRRVMEKKIKEKGKGGEEVERQEQDQRQS
jgi:hypothetical protein